MYECSSAGTLAQLCMWQLVVGYNLREMEAREELNMQLSAGDESDLSSNERNNAAADDARDGDGK